MRPLPCWSLLICFASLLNAQPHPYALPEPVKEPRLLLEGIISTPDDDLNATFTPDGKTVYFCKNVPNRLGVMLESRFESGRWSIPVVVPFSGRYMDYDPALSADGKTMFFCSNRPKADRSGTDFDLYRVDRTPTGWGEPRNLGSPVNTESNEFYPSVSIDGTLIFSSNRPGGKGGYDIYIAERTGSTFSEPVNLGDSINVQSAEIDNFLAPDKSYIIFAGYGRSDSHGNGDLYISYFVNGTWTRATNLGPVVNTAQREYCPVVSPDGKYFFWTSFRSFADSPPADPIGYAELIKNLRGTLNGNGNVWMIDAEQVIRNP